MDESGFSLDASTLSPLLALITARSLDVSVLKLIGKLVPKEGVDAPCFSVQIASRDVKGTFLPSIVCKFVLVQFSLLNLVIQ